MKTCLAVLLVLVETSTATYIRERVNIDGPYVYRSKLIIGPERGDRNYYNNEDKARITKTSHFEQNYKVGQKITFICVATGIPRPEITWFKNGYELYDHPCFTVHETHVGNSTVKSKMEIEPATQKDDGYYECRADNLYAVDRRRFRANIIILSF